MAKAKRKSRKTPGARASWRGQLTFGLVSFPVEAFNAIDREHGDIHFHQIHGACHRRIQYQKVCPVHGEVDNVEIVSGYEFKKGKYVEVEPDELDALRTARERALKVDAFVSPAAVDPLYFDGRMYYLSPADATAAEPYAVIVEAMSRAGRYGIGQLVFSGKDQLALIRPLDGVLHMALLNYEAEIRPYSMVAATFGRPRDLARKVRLAQTLIAEWSDDHFDFGQYHDPYREKVAKLIKAKMRGRVVTPPEDDDEPQTVLNLMDALQKSVRAMASRPPGRGKTRRRSA